MNSLSPVALPRIGSMTRRRDLATVLALLPEQADITAPVIGAAFLASPYASFVLDWQGRIMVCNRRAERTFLSSDPVEAGRFVGQPFANVTRHTPDYISRVLKEGAAKGNLVLNMIRAMGPPSEDGTVFRVSLLRSATRGERLYLLTQDQLKTTADALTRMNDRRLEVNAKLERLETAHLELHRALIGAEAFARAATHDLRTPINALSGLLELFNDKFAEDLPPKAGEYLSYMQRAVEQMSGLTSDLLDHARSSMSRIEAAEVFVGDIARGVVADADYLISTAGGTVTFDGEDFTVLAEANLLKVLVANLLANAIKYRSPDRALSIAIRLSRLPGGVPVMEIADNGIGFDDAEAKDIFKPFVRLGANTEGMGIGLATCSEVCHRHNWHISACSSAGAGAQFRVVFGQPVTGAKDLPNP